MIEKSLLLKELSSTTPLPKLDATPNTHSGADFLPKTTTERQNQADLDYFNLYLDWAYGKGEIVSVRKDMYYRNVVFFVQYLQSFVAFQSVALVKANIATSLRGFTLEWYTSEFSDFDYNVLNNNSAMKSWVNTLFHCFKVPMSMTLNFFTNEIYSFDNA